MHKDSIKPGMKVLIVDWLLATGGTVEAAAALIEEMGGEVVGMEFRDWIRRIKSYWKTK